jgi:hypothetical protein
MPVIRGQCAEGQTSDMIGVDGREYPVTQTCASIAKSKEMYGKNVEASINPQGVINFIKLTDDTSKYAAQAHAEQKPHNKNYSGKGEGNIIVWQNHMTSATNMIISLKPKGTLKEIADQILELTRYLYDGTEEKFS